jgi:hypothetical protein
MDHFDSGMIRVVNRRWNLEYSKWNMEDGRWKMEYSKWKMEDGLISNYFPLVLLIEISA